MLKVKKIQLQQPVRSCFWCLSRLFIYLLGTTSAAWGQVIPDGTLPQNTVVTSKGNMRVIEQGTRIGDNLFHSFSVFSLPTGDIAFFNNALDVRNIINRVTGSNISNIDGVIRTNGTANLFLINPNGIIFGPNARLDVGGAFVASTADGIKLGIDGLFSATEPAKSGLLTVQPGVLFSNALRQQQAEIRNQGNLIVPSGQTLTLQADNVTSMGSLTAPGGIVQVLGTQVNLLNNASIDVASPTGGGTVLIGNGRQIQIGSGVRINADALRNGNGGTIIVKSDDTARFQGRISARGGQDSGHGGFVDISAGNLQFTGTVDTSASRGSVGQLLLDPKDILIQSGGTISGLAVSLALAINNIILQANNDITVDDNITGIGANNLTLLAGRSLILANNRSIILNGGNFIGKINDETALAAERDAGIARFVMNPGARILTNGGSVTIASGTFTPISAINTVNGAIITSNARSNSGNINLFALGDITTGLLDSRSGTGKGGDISMTSAGGAIATTNSVFADSSFQAGNISLTAAGNLSITADKFNVNGNITSNGAVPGKIALTSRGILSIRGVVLVNTILGSGTPKSITNGITFTAKSIVLEDSLVTANTFSNDRGGDMVANATDEVVLRNSNLSTNANSRSNKIRPTGNAGNLTVNTRRLTIIHDAGSTFAFPVGVGTLANAVTNGNAGNLTIDASESVEIVGNRPGPFTIIPNKQAEAILQGNTGISTSALGGGNSGNLTVNTGRLVVRDGAGVTTYPTQGKGGDLTVNAGEILLQGQGGIATTATLTSKDAGNLTLNAERVTLVDGAAIATATFGSGKAGDLTLSVRQLDIRNGSAISTGTLGQGDGGKLTIKNSDSIEAIGTSPDGSFTSGIYANSLGAGKGAPIEINTRTLKLDNGRINASTVSSGDGGDITIRASDSVEVAGAGYDVLQQQIILPALNGTISLANFNRGIVSATAGKGAAGNILIETPNFIARNGGSVATPTLAQGKGGDITVNASNTLRLENSLLSAGTFSDAPSGQVRLSTRKLVARGGAQVLTTTFGPGKAGTLTVNASDSIDVIDPNNSGTLTTSGLFASSARTASGKGGDINMTTGSLNIRDRSAVSVSAEGKGNAGDINIHARSIFLDRSSITATSTSGEGGNIKLWVADNLIMRRNSQISTRAGTQSSGGGKGGNLDIDSQFIVSVPQENSDITANAFAGRGGNINLTAQSIFGVQVSKNLTPRSDITASSQLGINGTVTINTPDVDPVRGLTELPSTLADPSERIAAGCPANKSDRFTVTGRGGLPEDPTQPLRGRAVWQDLRLVTSTGDAEKQTPTTQSRSLAQNQQSVPLIEATGWVMNGKGQVQLVAYAPEVTPQSPWSIPADCSNLRR